MPRPGVDLEIYKDFVVELYQENCTIDEICQKLRDSHGLTLSARTLRCRLKDWDISKIVHTKDTAQLRLRIATLFLECYLDDEEILDLLREEKYMLSSTGLVRIRKSMGLLRRLPLENRQEADRQLRELVQLELAKGEITGYGRELLHTHFRAQGYIASRDRLFAVVRELDPEGVAQRTNRMQRHRGEYVVAGPNQLWSLDGYCKLEQYGFQVYAAIDAYSRYVVWCYVGISARTQISVLRQYLDTIQDLDIMPQIIRSDRGVETPLMANAHHELWLKSVGQE
ncbi:MAG: hypothetical protein M1816_001870, partial [Peltula sp. TS41687]